VRVAGPHGLLPADTADAEVPRVVFTHPKDTFGQIELYAKTERDMERDPLFDPDWKRTRWRDDHPLGIVRLAHMTNGVDDLERAKQVFGDLLGGDVFHETADEHSERAYVLVGVDTVIELARPVDPTTRLGRDLEANGPLPHMVTFRVRDLDAAAAHLESAGVALAERTDDTVVVDPATMSDALIGFTTADLPNDPRL
jgi:catechol 2,3-dioxygenase-like lactoylglutathione lyase family enzyme